MGNRYTIYYDGSPYNVKELKLGEESNYPIYETPEQAEEYVRLANKAARDEVIERVGSIDRLMKFLFDSYMSYDNVAKYEAEIIKEKIKEFTGTEL